MSLRKKLLVVAGVFFIILLIYFAFLHMKIREQINSGVPKSTEFIIILGARVKGTEPSLSLQYRIDAAADYLKLNPNTVAIASGGKGPGEDISEAEAIQIGLIAHGIDEARIILEDKSTSTVENIKFSQKMIPDNLNKGLLVTNDFHIYRAKLIAKDHGLKVEGLPAKTPTIAIPKSYLREYLAITKYYLIKPRES
ncbi:YdcF family protein [Neobacillus sp. FSL H8-0543]|uniref:YdcF family protein n=1 Tax=Neobacillus sp. FSL H8-0543 TaxID=2954672 RepID=UPI0031585DDE